MQYLIEYVQMHVGSVLGLVIIFFLSCIEVSKIQINPISAILRFIGKACNSTLYEEMKELKDSQAELSKQFDKTYNAMQARFKDIDNQIDDKFTRLGEKINETGEKIYKVDAMTSRYRLIRAAEDVVCGVRVSKDRLEVLLNDDMKTYQRYCNEHPTYINHKGQRSLKILLDYESEVLENERQSNEAH